MSQQIQTWSQFFFSFEGRVSRKRWWLHYFLPLVVPMAVLSIVIDRMMGYQHRPTPGSLMMLLILWPGLAVSTKRWHDRNKSGWWNLVALVPLIGGVWILVENGFLRGTVGSNQYGPDSAERET